MKLLRSVQTLTSEVYISISSNKFEAYDQNAIVIQKFTSKMKRCSRTLFGSTEKGVTAKDGETRKCSLENYL